MDDEPELPLLDLSGARTGWIVEYRESLIIIGWKTKRIHSDWLLWDGRGVGEARVDNILVLKTEGCELLIG